MEPKLDCNPFKYYGETSTSPCENAKNHFSQSWMPATLISTVVAAVVTPLGVLAGIKWGGLALTAMGLSVVATPGGGIALGTLAAVAVTAIIFSLILGAQSCYRYSKSNGFTKVHKDNTPNEIDPSQTPPAKVRKESAPSSLKKQKIFPVKIYKAPIHNQIYSHAVISEGTLHKSDSGWNFFANSGLKQLNPVPLEKHSEVAAGEWWTMNYDGKKHQILIRDGIRPSDRITPFQ